MDEKIWDFDLDKIEPQELSEREKKIAEECAEIQMEFEETISMLNFSDDEK